MDGIKTAQLKLGLSLEIDYARGETVRFDLGASRYKYWRTSANNFGLTLGDKPKGIHGGCRFQDKNKDITNIIQLAMDERR
jgi:hypothetical protein